MRRIAWLVLLCAAPLAAQQLKVASHTLANGMQILVHEDHDVPNVALYFFFKIGSRNERPGATGISHFFEHMMFNGAKKFGPKQFDIQMERAGGRNNASTGRDLTTYTDWFPSSALPLIFEMEADRIRDLQFDPKMVESERGVIASERRTGVDNSPRGVLMEQLNATAYIAHPYQWPVVGWASDIESWTMDDLKAHFKMGYAPNNCVVVAAGDVTPAQVLALARQHLEPIPRQDPPPAVRTREPEQLGERRIEVRRRAALPLVAVSYHIPRTDDAATPALDVLENVLAGGRSSRLYRRLVETDQVALSVSVSAGGNLDPGQLIAMLQVRSGVDPRKAEAALYEEFDKIAAGGVTAAEMEKARNQLQAGRIRQLKTIAGKAGVIGRYQVYYGDWSKLNRVEAEYERVTAADVQRAAAQYLQPANRTVATLVPEAPAAAAASAKEGR